MIYRTSSFILITSGYAWHRKHYRLSMGHFILYLTSIHYWKKPVHSYRRYLDMSVVCSGMLYQLYLSRGAEYQQIHNILMASAVLSYGCSSYYQYKNDNWKSTYCHIMLHILGNIASIILYSGKIKKKALISN